MTRLVYSAKGPTQFSLEAEDCDVIAADPEARTEICAGDVTSDAFRNDDEAA